MGPYYDTAVEIHQEHLSRAEENRLRRLRDHPPAERKIGPVQQGAFVTAIIAVIAVAGRLT
ncbi:MAG: hypothetical protein AAFV19_11545 [Pseudomonadota bacterium]